MAKFKVLRPLRFDGKDYTPGKTVEMDPAQAAKIPWAVEPLGAPPQSKNGGGEKPKPEAAGEKEAKDGKK